MGRLHRLLVLSGNDVKAKFLKPIYEVDFCLRPDEKWFGDLLVEGCRAGDGGGMGGGGGGKGDGERGGGEGDGGSDEERLNVGDTAGEIVEEESNSEAERRYSGSQGKSESEEDIDLQDCMVGAGEDIEEITVGEWIGSRGSSPTREEGIYKTKRGSESAIDGSAVEVGNKDETRKAEKGPEESKENNDKAMPEKGKAKEVVDGPPGEVTKKTAKETVGEEEQPRVFRFPLGNSIDIESVLDDLKQKVCRFYGTVDSC